jgi:choline dehydrogenase-like flavoprotein
MSVPEDFDVVVIGSGPVGSAFARVLKDDAPAARILLVESGPLISRPPGRHVKTITDPAEREAAQVASQGPVQVEQAAFGAAARARAVAAGEPLPISARPGTWLLGPGAVQPGEDGMPAAALSSNVGGMGAHWTCASPTPGDGERVTVIAEADLDRAYSRARELLSVTQTAFAGAPLGEEVRELLGKHLNSGREPDRVVQPMPLAIRITDDGSRKWTAPDVILGDLVTTGRPGFELRPETIARRIIHGEGTVSPTAGATAARTATSVLLHDRIRDADYEVRARYVVVACDAFRSPQLLFASGITPPALGCYLNDQPQVSGTVLLDDSFIPHDVRTHRSADGDVDILSGVSWIPYDRERFPFHGQIMQMDYSPVPVDGAAETWPGSIVEVGLFAAKDLQRSDRVEVDPDELDEFGLPAIRIHYNLTESDRRALREMVTTIEELAGLLGRLVNGDRPFVFPNGNSIHYQGSVRMGATDDGESVCGPDGRVWGTTNVFVGGNGVIPTPIACNPTLTSVALAVYSAQGIAADLRTPPAAGPDS